MKNLSRRQFLWCAASTAAAAVLAACAPRSSEPQPPEITYGQDVCEGCGMLISEPRFAGAVLLAEGPYLKFDDLGDMVVYYLDRPNLKITAWFAHDYYSEEWVRAEKASFVASTLIASPMGHGLAAFATRASAEAFARSNCNVADCPVLDFDGLRAHVHEHLHA